MLVEYSPALVSDFFDTFSKLFSAEQAQGVLDLFHSALNVTYDDCVRYLDVSRLTLHFDDQQITLLTILSSFFIFNVSCIGLMWKSHGSRVFKKFKKPATRKVIEELKRSVDQLKLPKVHSPRI